MRHDWIFDTLMDLEAYADRNGLPGLRRKVLEALVIAREEIGASRASDNRTQPAAGPPH
jgi:hypothetical protein